VIGDEVFVISRIIKVEVSVISRAEDDGISLTLSTNDDSVWHKTTFGSQKKPWQRFKILR
jgi:hypothetical protein